MKRIITLIFAISLVAQSFSQNNTNTKNLKTMKFNTGIITEKLNETKEFYSNVLGFGVTFENEFYILMHTPNHQAEISFLKPNHPTQKPIFQKAFNGSGIYITIEIENVDKLYEDIKKKGVEIEVDLRDEPWGDRHFAIVDPNGIGIDLVTYTDPNKK